jgi:Papain family cysteine protease
MKKLLKTTMLFFVMMQALEAGAQETKNYIISAAQKWIDTGIDLKQGEKVEISSRGSWSNGGSNPQQVGPTGFAGVLIGSTLAPNLPLASLIAMVNNSTFLVGELYSNASPVSGRLFLSMNDDDFSDNKGQLRVSVVYTVHRFATGVVVPAKFREHVIRQNAIAKIRMDQLRSNPVNKFSGKYLSRPKSLPYPPGLSHFDWREEGVSSPVMDQQQCGSCWDFAGCSAFEECWKFVNRQTINVSEQHVLDCNPRGRDCGGGWISDAFDLITDIGIARESDYPYIGSSVSCNQALSKPYKAYAWGYVGDDDGVPSVDELKKALYYNGPLAICVNATEAFSKFRSLPGEVFNEGASGTVNHCVTLVGWDDNQRAWLIKNSWGLGGWGDQGYGWVAYGTNNIGFGAAWIAPHGVEEPISPPHVKTFTIKPPIVSRKDVIYDGNNASPKIEFQPGDQVQIEAGGCVQTGGVGKTWKRYVDPLGLNSDRLYFGSIHLPGYSNNQMTAFRNLVGGQPFAQKPDVWKFSFTVSSRISGQEKFLHLGYMDDDYRDNGYWSHDDGTQDQCKNVGNAYLIIKITRTP